MTSESDEAFVESEWGYLTDGQKREARWQRLFALARCGAAVENHGQVEKLSEEIERLREEVKVWVNHTKTAVWSDSEECKMLTRINEALIAAPTVDVDVVVPDRDYSTMTPRDCYEAGLLDGVYQAREAIKAAARAALEDRT